MIAEFSETSYFTDKYYQCQIICARNFDTKVSQKSILFRIGRLKVHVRTGCSANTHLFHKRPVLAVTADAPRKATTISRRLTWVGCDPPWYHREPRASSANA